MLLLMLMVVSSPLSINVSPTTISMSLIAQPSKVRPFATPMIWIVCVCNVLLAIMLPHEWCYQVNGVSYLTTCYTHLSIPFVSTCLFSVLIDQFCANMLDLYLDTSVSHWLFAETLRSLVNWPLWHLDMSDFGSDISRDTSNFGSKMPNGDRLSIHFTMQQLVNLPQRMLRTNTLQDTCIGSDMIWS